MLPINGKRTLAQRFAIDCEQLGSDGRIYAGGKNDVHSYRIYGQPVLAVGDATVVATHDGLSDQVPGAYPANLPITEADGNYIVLELGNGSTSTTPTCNEEAFDSARDSECTRAT